MICCGKIKDFKTAHNIFIYFISKHSKLIYLQYYITIYYFD
jgi:hypothetical protein